MIEALFSFRFCGFFVSFDSDKHLVVDRRLALGIERSKFRFFVIHVSTGTIIRGSKRRAFRRDFVASLHREHTESLTLI